MDAKTIMYFVLAGITIIGAVVAFSKQFSKIDDLGKGQTKIMNLLYPSDGKARFQNVEDCKFCRKECKDEICDYMTKEMKRFETGFLRFHSRLDDFRDDLKDLNSEVQKINVWMPERNK